MNDIINHPQHYHGNGKVECIDAIISATGGAAYCVGNIIKYVWRYRDKGGIEDLKKCRWYIDKLIEIEEGPKNDG